MPPERKGEALCSPWGETDDPGLVGAVSAQFDEVWSGAFCEACGRKAWCGDCPME